MQMFRKQQEKLAARFLAWQYEKMNLPVPPEEKLNLQASQLVDDARRIAKARGKNLLAIIKDAAREFVQKKD